MTKRILGIPVALLLWLGLLGLIVRVWGLEAYCFSPDDLMHLRVASGKTLGQVWESGLPLTNGPLMYFLLHCLLKISKNELFLRSISLVPGMGLIFAFFFLGRKASGTLSGLAMACMASFGNGAILLSQGIRPYSLMVFFLSIALCAVLCYWEERNDKYLCAYVLFMSLAIFSHYPAILPMTAIACVCLGRACLQRKGIRAYAKILLVHLPLLIQVGLLYRFHVYRFLGNASSAGVRQEYVKPYFPRTSSGLIENIPGLFEYLFLPSAVVPAIVLTVLGVVVLWRTSRGSLAAIILATFATGFLFTLMGIYPFGGSRHSIYLFPFVALSIGASVQWLFDCFRGLLTSPLASGDVQRMGRHQRVFLGTGVACLVVSTLALCLRYEKYDFRRAYIYLGGYDEFPLTREDYDRIMNDLKSGVGPKDVILCNRQTTEYFFYDQDDRDVEVLSKRLERTSWEGRDLFFVKTWKFDNPTRLRGALRDLKLHAEFDEDSKVWLLNIGWRDLFGGRVVSDVVSEKAVCSELCVLGGFVISFKGLEVLRKLEAVDDSATRGKG
jgi:hypothetical protein